MYFMDTTGPNGKLCNGAYTPQQEVTSVFKPPRVCVPYQHQNTEKPEVLTRLKLFHPCS
jgi:hypothetical protein